MPDLIREHYFLAAMSIEGTSSSGMDSMDDLSAIATLDDALEQHHQQPPLQIHPRSQDVLMMERPMELPSQEKGTTRKKNSAPRSKLGVMALQAEALASEAGQELKQEEERHRKEQERIEAQLVSSHRTGECAT